MPGESGLDLPAAILTGADLDALDDVELRHASTNVNIFARVVPEQKLRLVKALRPTAKWSP